MPNQTDIQYNINLKTSADNSGVDDVKSKITALTESAEDGAQQQINNGKKVEDGIANQGNALAWLGSTWTKVAAGMTAAMGVFGLIMQAVSSLKSLWDWWNKDAIEAEKKKQEELEKTKAQVTQLKAIVEELQLSERNNAAAKLATERWEKERKAIEARNAAIQRGIDMQHNEELIKAHREGTQIEIERINLKKQLREGKINEIEWTQQDIALRQKAADIQRQTDLATPQSAAKQAEANVTAAQSNVQTAENSYNTTINKLTGLNITDSDKFAKTIAYIVDASAQLKKNQKEEMDNASILFQGTEEAKNAKMEDYDKLFSEFKEKLKAKQQAQWEPINRWNAEADKYQEVLKSEGFEGKDDNDWVAKAKKFDDAIKEKFMFIEEATKALTSAEKVQADAQNNVNTVMANQEVNKNLEFAQGTDEIESMIHAKNKEAKAKQDAIDKEEQKKSMDAQMTQFAKDLLAGIEAKKTTNNPTATANRGKVLGDASTPESKLITTLQDVLAGGDKRIDKQESSQLDALLGELQSSANFQSALGRDIMAVVNKNLGAAITLQLSAEKNRVDIAALANKAAQLEAQVKNIRN